MSGFSNQQLVVTAIGEDRPGIVGALTQLVSDCNCNIIDSRIAILGNEFSFIMLLAGDMSAISRIEHTLPTKSVELGLLTMMKRTSSHQSSEYSAGYTIEYSGVDAPGTLSRVTKLLAQYHLSISSLKSDTFDCEGALHMRSELEINLPFDVEFDEFKLKFENLCNEFQLEHILRRIR
ncbi:glycine cleavage system protein R [Pseudoalteromonas tunicata]|uniref:Glycine cleavage system transcriptional repressor n=1 Tax=Pseudoalteromonas tunicata D2 TaxID=87626 RepID=A4CBC2_9GAMM|nr:ACT domain-containing protein [Pseudoalteromonas tunicata]ATC94214.1 glycine cleavage system transcriptional repressor [Pseudoalteromonas tunicata]AXT29973.1 glycine cleavage system transcriptional repressor [Pseudoalteromonas tunicata]EAR27659.1 transcriptional repressor for cleavage of glycine [Pseudoalteromonas tunicata D2]MDP4983030.1 glycine cleavage system transcriptional repressor [Pseudoalteromonas tunicata]MDP5211442.1 glycine cleavage system transcriptional repressor [Pseudoaltero